MSVALHEVHTRARKEDAKKALPAALASISSAREAFVDKSTARVTSLFAWSTSLVYPPMWSALQRVRATEM